MITRAIDRGAPITVGGLQAVPLVARRELRLGPSRFRLHVVRARPLAVEVHPPDGEPYRVPIARRRVGGLLLAALGAFVIRRLMRD